MVRPKELIKKPLTIKFSWLKSQHACEAGIKWFLDQSSSDVIFILDGLIREDRFNYANWLIERVLNPKQLIQYAVFAAEQVIEKYERQYPVNSAPRLAIEAAKLVIKRNTKINRERAQSAANAAVNAANAANAAAYAAYAAAYAANAAYATMKQRILTFALNLLKGEN